jgi:GATA-binding protein
MDDLTFTSPSSIVGSPGDSSGVGHSPANDNNNNIPTSRHASASAIPIKKEKDKAIMMNINGTPASAPQNHFDMREHEGEFAYVQRRMRKTSVDERRVSFFFPVHSLSYWRICFNIRGSHPSEGPNSRRWFILSQVS